MKLSAQPEVGQSPKAKDGFQNTSPLNGPLQPTRQKLAALVLVVIPLLAVVAALLVLPKGWIAWHHLIILVLLYLFTGFGLTMGFHRGFTHKSFAAKPWLRKTLCIAGSMAFQGPVTFWAAIHRSHHQYSDRQGDPHSPVVKGHGVRETVAGLWHAHIGWMFRLSGISYRRYVPDLLRDRDLMHVTRRYWQWVGLGVVLPGLFALPLDLSLRNFLMGCLVGGPVRIFLVSHATWSVNSLCHLFGSQPHPCGDSSRNNAWCAIWSLGEAWHNNHHAFPVSARHGLERFQVDPTFWLIRICEKCGWVDDVKTPKTSVRA